MSEEIKDLKQELNEFDEEYVKLYEKYCNLKIYITSLQQKVKELENIRKEAIESIERGYVVFCKQDKECLLNFRKNMLNILNKGSDKE